MSKPTCHVYVTVATEEGLERLWDKNPPPTGFRLAVSRNWASRWYANNRDFAGMLAEDIKVREYLKAKLKNAAVSRVLIERPPRTPASRFGTSGRGDRQEGRGHREA